MLLSYRLQDANIVIPNLFSNDRFGLNNRRTAVPSSIKFKQLLSDQEERSVGQTHTTQRPEGTQQ